MRCTESWVGMGCVIAVVSGCAGKLEVGEDSQRGAATEAASESTVDGSGGTTPAAAVSTYAGADAGTTGQGTSDVAEGSWVDAITPVLPVPGSSEGCPLGPQRPDGACETEGLECLYQYEDGPSLGNQRCYCVRSDGDRHVWNCHHGSADERCPAAPPDHGSDCYGYFDLGCVYPPEFECNCDGSEGTWNCPAQAAQELPQELPSPPDNVDPARLVGELSDEERTAWCEWYESLHSGGPGHPPVPDRPVSEGYATGPACAVSRTYCRAALPSISVAQCVANLSLSECESPLAYLSGCVLDMVGLTCGPFDYDCLDYLELPNCRGTMVLGADEPGGCNLRVE